MILLRKISTVLALAIVPAVVSPESAQAQSLPADLAPFQDCGVCPKMIALPKGSFMMGASAADKRVPFAVTDNEEPRHEVTFAYRFAISAHTITVDEFAAFVDDTGFRAGGECLLRIPDTGGNRGRFDGKLSPNAGEYERGNGVALVEHADFRHPGTKVAGNQPATCISRNEAKAYLAWLSSRTGRQYRLPSEAEFEYATRAGEDGPYFFGASQAKLCEYANFADRKSVYGAGMAAPCAEKGSREYTYPVGSFKPNRWGLYDMVGNVFQFVEDCAFDDYSGAPGDGSPFQAKGGACPSYATRGFFFDSLAVNLRSAARCEALASEDERSNGLGLRVAVSLDGDAWDRK